MTGEPESYARRAILEALRRSGSRTTAELAAHLGVTGEAVRQHLRRMEAAGLVTARITRPAAPSGGRPVARYDLAPKAEALFPKRYEDLAVEMLDAVDGALGADATRRLLASLTEARVREWEPKLRGKSLPQRLALLKDVYVADDPHAAMEVNGRQLRLVERNCPFLEVALRRPILCSVTVSALSRLLGYQVEREERFQDGDGRCVFRVRTDRPVAANRSAFVAEPDVRGRS